MGCYSSKSRDNQRKIEDAQNADMAQRQKRDHHNSEIRHEMEMKSDEAFTKMVQPVANEKNIVLKFISK